MDIRRESSRKSSHCSQRPHYGDVFHPYELDLGIKEALVLNHLKQLRHCQLPKLNIFVMLVKDAASNMDILKIFRMQEPVSKEILSKNNEIGQYKEVVQEKDVLLKNNRARIKELEEQISELEARNRQLENQLKLNNMDGSEFQSIMKEYDKFIAKIWMERQELLNEITALNIHTKNLESTCKNLEERYEKAKVVIEGLRKNEETLKNELCGHKQVIDGLEKKYDCLKTYSESKLNEANIEIDNKDKGNIQEVAKLKAKILQSEATINELQKHVNLEKITSRPSMFAPLKSNIPKV